MKYTDILLKTSKEKPADEPSKNAELLIRGGYINKEMAGVYSFLPLGLKVLRNIENIVRREMEKVGASELLMPAMSPKSYIGKKLNAGTRLMWLFKIELAGR